MKKIELVREVAQELREHLETEITDCEFVIGARENKIVVFIADSIDPVLANDRRPHGDRIYVIQPKTQLNEYGQYVFEYLHEILEEKKHELNIGLNVVIGLYK